jgi:hypothetical protein
VVKELRALFGKSAVIHGEIRPSAPSVERADFLFVDPPSVASQWKVLLELVQRGRRLLAWLPVNVGIVSGSPGVSRRAGDQLREVMELEGFKATRVLWASSGRMVGCQLIYRTSPRATDAVRRAVDEVVSLCDWQRPEVNHFDS